MKEVFSELRLLCASLHNVQPYNAVESQTGQPIRPARVPGPATTVSMFVCGVTGQDPIDLLLRLA